MNLIQALRQYIESHNIKLDDLASRLDISLDTVQKFLYIDEDLYLSEFEEVLNVLNITYSDLFAMASTNGLEPTTVDNTLGMIYETLSTEDKEVIKQIMEALENMDAVIKVPRRSNYYN